MLIVFSITNTCLYTLAARRVTLTQCSKRLISGKSTTSSPRRKAASRSSLTRVRRMHSSSSSSGLIWAPTLTRTPAPSTPSHLSRFFCLFAQPTKKSNLILISISFLLLLVCLCVFIQVREQWEYDHHLFNKGVLLWQAGGWESRDGIRPIWEWPFRLPHPSFAHVRVHDQLYSQAQTPARKVHDEQRSRELHHPSGKKLYIKPRQ